MKFLILSLFLLCTISTAATLPGVRADISEEGLNYVKDVMLPELEKQLAKASIPDVSGDTSTPIGKVSYSLTQITLKSFSLSDVHLSLSSPSSAAIQIGGLSLSMSMHWHYKEHSIPHISDSGTADAKTSKASAKVAITIEVDSNGRPKAYVSDCSTNVGNLDITLHGGASWLYNIFISVFHSQIVHSLDSGLCAQVKSSLNDMLAKSLSTVPITQEIGGHMGIGYKLTSNPSFVPNPSRLSVPALGEAYALSEGPGHTPEEPVAMPLAVSGRYFEALVSQFTFDSFAYAAWKAGDLKKFLTKNDAPSAAASFFSTSFYKPYAPGIWTKYGKVDVGMNLICESLPTLTIDTDGFIGRFPVTIGIYPYNATKSSYDEAFAVISNVMAIGEIDIVNNTLSGVLRILNSTTALKETLVGNIDVDGMNDLVAFALGMAQDLANDYLSKGVPMPVVQGITLTHPLIVWKHGYLSISSDFTYVPPSFAY